MHLCAWHIPVGSTKINYRNILAQYMDNVKWLDTRFCIKHTLIIKLALLMAGLDIFGQRIYCSPLMGRQYYWFLIHEMQGQLNHSGLFVIIVPFALGYNNIFSADYINKPVFVIDPSAPFPFRAVF